VKDDKRGILPIQSQVDFQKPVIFCYCLQKKLFKNNFQISPQDREPLQGSPSQCPPGKGKSFRQDTRDTREEKLSLV